MRPALAVAVALVAITAGCAGQGRAPEPITANASRATVPGDALDATDYRRATVERVPVNASGQLSISGDVQMDLRYRINATGWRAVYRTPSSPPGVFAVLSVPLVSPEQVAATINPLAGRSPAALATLAQREYTAVAVSEHVGNRTARLLGNETTVRTYAATGTVDGETVEVALSVATATHGGDVVVAVAIAPRSGEADLPTRLLESVRH